MIEISHVGLCEHLIRKSGADECISNIEIQIDRPAIRDRRTNQVLQIRYRGRIPFYDFSINESDRIQTTEISLFSPQKSA